MLADVKAVISLYRKATCGVLTMPVRSANSTKVFHREVSSKHTFILLNFLPSTIKESRSENSN